ncbi:MAG: response regulator [Calditrichaeota bacterium]|nr:response regulator [Calditrichota bacterium]
MSDKILCVDDDANILAGYRRQLHKQFHLETAQSAAEGLKTISERGPFAVVVSDLRMPGMDGIEFLGKVRSMWPNTVRVMLTGNADLDSAINAVNDGNIFRFLTKPCPAHLLAKAIISSIEQYRLVTAEKELLEKTFKNSIKVLVDVLAMVNPLAFSRSSRVKHYVRHIVRELKLPNLWQFEIAVMLSQIGCVTVPQEVLEKVLTNIPLTPKERKIFNSHPSVAYSLLSKIPRLEIVSKIIAGQLKPLGSASEMNFITGDVVALGSQILKVALDFDQLHETGTDTEKAVQLMLEQPDQYDPNIVSALRNVKSSSSGMEVKLVTAQDVTLGMILAENVYTKKGLLLVAKGKEVTYTVLKGLRNFSQGVGIQEPFRVYVPRAA